MDAKNTKDKKTHIPCDLPLTNLNLSKLMRPLEEANSALSSFMGSLKTINPDLLMTSLKSNEAMLSSRIEGTQTHLEEVIGVSDEEEIKNDDDLKEILNYRRTLSLITRDYDTPISLHQIRAWHKELLKGSVRGFKKNPGQFRKTQNYIGKKGLGIENARFIPPDPALLQSSLENWIKYANLDNENRILQIAILHAQFEILHPFDDGNGRIGRLLISAFLYKKKYMPHSCFYLSEFLEKNKDEYYNNLLSITKDGNWEQWIIFFCKAVKIQANVYENRIESILALYKGIKEREREGIKSMHFIPIIDYIFKIPVFDIPSITKNLSIDRLTATRIVKNLEQKHIIEIHKPSRGAIPTKWIFKDLITLL